MKKIVVVYILLMHCYFVFGQSREELEKQRAQAIKDINFTNQLISNTEKNKKLSYNKIYLIESKIKARQSIISNIGEEVDYLDKNILTHQELISGLENDLINIKNEYSKIIYNSFKHKNKYDKIIFLLASDNFNTAFKRLKYYQQYSKYRKFQAERILVTKNKLSDEIVQLEILKAEKKDLLIDKKLEAQRLYNEKSEKKKEVNLLIGKEQDLRKKLKEQYDLSNRLHKEITRIIEEEARKAAELLKKNNNDFFQLTPEERLIADIFSKNKSKLPWPTQRGIITGDFGEQPHPFLKGVKVRNDGVDITTTEGAIVRSVYDGTVSRIFALPGAHKTVIIRHGNFLTVYSNLKEVTVNQGDKVKTKQTIGVVYTNKENESRSVLQFQIWKENIKLDPKDWLAKTKNG